MRKNRLTSQPSPMVAPARFTPLPACAATADQIIRDIIEGYPDATRPDVTRGQAGTISEQGVS